MKLFILMMIASTKIIEHVTMFTLGGPYRHKRANDLCLTIFENIRAQFEENPEDSWAIWHKGNI